jgi:hypothetical protein
MKEVKNFIKYLEKILEQIDRSQSNDNYVSMSRIIYTLKTAYEADLYELIKNLPSDADIHNQAYKYYGNAPGERSMSLFKHGAAFFKSAVLVLLEGNGNENFEWKPFISSDLSTFPQKTGKYLVAKKDGQNHWETWNGSGWAYNHNAIVFWAIIPQPNFENYYLRNNKN